MCPDLASPSGATPPTSHEPGQGPRPTGHGRGNRSVYDLRPMRNSASVNKQLIHELETSGPVYQSTNFGTPRLNDLLADFETLRFEQLKRWPQTADWFYPMYGRGVNCKTIDLALRSQGASRPTDQSIMGSCHALGIERNPSRLRCGKRGCAPGTVAVRPGVVRRQHGRLATSTLEAHRQRQRCTGSAPYVPICCAWIR